MYFDAGSSANDQPYLALGTSDGRVSLLNVTLWRNDNVIAGRKLKVHASSNINFRPHFALTSRVTERAYFHIAKHTLSFSRTSSSVSLFPLPFR